MTSRQRLLGQYVAELYRLRVVSRDQTLAQMWDRISVAVWDDLAFILGTVSAEAGKRYAAALIDRVMGEIKVK